MKVCGSDASRMETASAVMGIIGAIGLVASIALGFYLKFGNLGKALHHTVSAANLGVTLGTVAALGLSGLLWKRKTAL